jgi:hypothetical protein
MPNGTVEDVAVGEDEDSEDAMTTGGVSVNL